jgi:MoxR-like ATPase
MLRRSRKSSSGAPLAHAILAPEFGGQLRADAVALTRATREHPGVRQGSSVRGAIDLTLIADEFFRMRDIRSAGGAGRLGHQVGTDRSAYTTAVFDAMVVALSGRIHLDETSDCTPEAVLREIWEDHFVLNPATASPG